MNSWQATKLTGGCVLVGVAVLVLFGQMFGAGPRSAQAELPKERIAISTRDGQRRIFNVEVATTEQQQVGEMFRSSVPQDGGMLFDWHREVVSHMWMRHTIVPLDMLFIGRDATIQRIAENAVPNTTTVISSNVPVVATLEVAGGTAKRLGIEVGDRMAELSDDGSGLQAGEQKQ